MTACHDPYRELELYLEKAQEEIGRAVKELEEHEENSLAKETFDWQNSSDNVLPPPQAFRSKSWDNNSNSKFTTTVNHSSAVNRFCHDGNLLDLGLYSGKPIASAKIHSPRTSFVSSFNFGISGKNGKTGYSPNTRRRLWRMHPSISFPETTKDLLLLGNDAQASSLSSCNNKPSTNELFGNVFHNGSDSRVLNQQNVKYRQRSNSDTSSPCVRYDKQEDLFEFPRPPSGDVNLLSIWANNLVLELDKSLSGELMNSTESFSPSSDYSLSPIKQEEPVGTNGENNHFAELHGNKSHSVEPNLLLSGVSLKEVSRSPDSGIEHISCNTPEMTEDCVDATMPKEKLEDINYDSRNFHLEDLHITPPPPQFGDGESTVSTKDRSQGTQTEKYCHRRNSCIKSAELVFETPETSETVENTSRDILPQAHAIPLKVIELEESPVVRTVCVVNDVSIVNSTGNKSEAEPVVKPIADRYFKQPLISDSSDYPMFSSLPKPPKTIPNGIDKWSSSLPRDGGKSSDAMYPQRCASQSAVSSMRYVSIDELAAFMRDVKINSYQPPSCADVSTDVKDDKENKDAITQTTPIPLSRSSSFTWVTECDCSDWNPDGASDESLAMSSCSNCKEEKRNGNSSSSSLGISSDDEDDCQPATPGSGSSSLYLSACSGSSDSFEEPTLTSVNDATSSESEKLADDVFACANSNQRSLRSSETTLRGSTLGDISEEQVTSETISMKSNISNQSLPDSNAADPEQSASFPSTLKMSRKCKSTGSPAQPIEPTVLVINELNLKSNSAPVLLRQKRYASSSKVPESSSSDSSPPTGSRNKDSLSETKQVPVRSHSAKELNELQAIEACGWLRAAGFPQYAQMYEDNQFPIDICIVQKDHAFLHPDSIQSLFRRLNTLNRCAKMKFMDHVHRKSLHMEESDDEEQYALSENWEFQRSSRRWSRIPSPSADVAEFVAYDPQAASKSPGHLLTTTGRKYLSPEEAYCSSHDSVFVDEQHSSPDSVRRSTGHKNEKVSRSPSGLIGDCSPGSSSGSGGTLSLASEDTQERRTLRRSGSDRVKEGAKALLRRMESLKGKRKKKVTDANKSENVNTTLNGTDGSSSSSLTSSPQFPRTQNFNNLAPELQFENMLAEGENISIKSGEDVSVHSDSECRSFLISNRGKSSSSSKKHTKHYHASKTSVTITSPADDFPIHQNQVRGKLPGQLKAEALKKNFLHPDFISSKKKEGSDKRSSCYDNVCAPLVVFNDMFTDSIGGSPYKPTLKTGGLISSFPDQDSYQNQEDGDIIILNSERRDSGVGSSLTRGISYQQAPWHCFPIHGSSTVKPLPSPVQITELTAPQILLLRKLSLLKLTTVMEKFSPSSRTGWSWGVQKFMSRIRNPDYKDKVVFGVPLLLILQRTGQPLPVSIQAAVHYLRKTALDSTGLFRKSGVRSRIQKLKTLNETTPDKISYEEQQAYDVADMLKQYFRELPEALLTNKLSETFITIFQHVPEDLRLEAIQAALMLMPDENREVLQSLLEFLYEVCQHSEINQMSATNLAVCFAPSLFHLSTPRSASSSPRRRKTVGVPDLRELNENRAAYECLSCMVTNYNTLFTVSDEVISQSRISSSSHFLPATLEDLSSFVCNGQSGWKSFIDNCIQVLLKEAKEKFKGWKTISQFDHVELAYRKLSDEHPLKLWKVSTEVEAPPVELLNRILRERQLWDNSFTKWKVISRLNKHTEVYQYLNTCLPPHPSCDYCILRSWRTDLPKGTCVLIESSIEHPDAENFPGSVRALVLASRYLIEPCGSGKSRITYISRVDTRGRSPEWYNRAYGHICTLFLIKLRSSFTHTRADGPETKV